MNQVGIRQFHLKRKMDESRQNKTILTRSMRSNHNMEEGSRRTKDRRFIIELRYRTMNRICVLYVKK